jgi:hypothetical protein
MEKINGPQAVISQKQLDALDALAKNAQELGMGYEVGTPAPSPDYQFQSPVRKNCTKCGGDCHNCIGATCPHANPSYWGNQ